MKRNDPALYRAMSVPHEDSEAVNKAVAAFFEEVAEARKKHRIADVVVIVEMSVLTDGEETRGSAKLALGDHASHLPMLAREYGASRQEYENHLALLLARARRGAK